VYQHRWVMYCKYIGKSLDHWDGSNVGYMSWVMDKWREFGALIGITKNERRMYHEQFDKWLLENAPAENQGTGEHVLTTAQA
jgi:hypothetical protein